MHQQCSLKDDLVKRRFEELQGNILGGEGTGGGATPGDDLKEDSTPGSADTTIGQATMEVSAIVMKDDMPANIEDLEKRRELIRFDDSRL